MWFKPLSVAGIVLVAAIGFNASAQKVWQESNGYVIMEAENTASPLGLWQNRTTPAGYTGTGGLEFTGNNPSSGPATSPLDYSFKIITPGEYRLYLKIYKNLQGEAEDKCNDVFVKVAGDFTAVSGGANLTTLQTDNKLLEVHLQHGHGLAMVRSISQAPILLQSIISKQTRLIP